MSRRDRALRISQQEYVLMMPRRILTPRRLARALAAFGTVVLLLPAAATAQTPAAGAQAPELPRWDLAGGVGWLGVRTTATVQATAYSNWHVESAAATLTAGRYWTEHVKLEVDAGVSTEVSTYHWEPFDPEVAFGCCQSRVDVSRYIKVSAGLVYQFRHNAMFHPFVGGGIDLDVERVRSVRPEQPVWSYPAPSGSVPERRRETTRARPGVFGTAGYKAYFSERVFFRNDVRVSTGSAPDQFTVRFGLGIDF